MKFNIKTSSGEFAEVQAKKEGKGWRAMCPFHDDTNPSLYIYPDGYFKCFGCGSTGKVLSNGEKINSNYNTLTLSDFASFKSIPVEFLIENYVRETEKGLTFFYLHEDGDPARAIARYRHSLNGSKRFSWEKGAVPTLYGLWKLKEFNKNEPLFIVEGESDALTLWFCGFQALGVPGVNSWKPEFAKHIKDFRRIFVVVEPDSKGRLFEDIKKSVKCIPMYFEKTGYKDPSEAYVLLGREAFVKFIKDLIEEAEASIPKILPVSQVQAKPVNWAIPNWFAKGVINLVAGDPGVGKTTLILNLLALASTGQGRVPTHNGFEQIEKRRSLYISLEDDLGSKVKPTLDALGVGNSQDIFLAYVENHQELTEILKDAFDFDIIVIDPLTNLLTDDINHIDKVLKLLTPFKKIARTKNIAIVVVWHLNKQKDILGSVGFKTIAKTVLLLGKGENSLILTQSKNAFSRPLPSFRLRIEDGIVSWIGISDTDVGETVSEKDAFVKDFILSVLQEKGEISFKELAEEAKREGISLNTLKVVGYRLERRGILTKVRLKDDNGKFQTTIWKINHVNNPLTVNMERTLENTESTPCKQSLKNESECQIVVNFPLKNNNFYRQNTELSQNLTTVNMDKTVEKSQLSPCKQVLTVNMDVSKKGIIGDEYLKSRIRELGIEIKKPPFEKFLSYLNFVSQRERERLGLFREEVFDLSWISQREKEMFVRAKKDIKIYGKLYKVGEVLKLSPEHLDRLKGIVEPVTDEEALEHKIMSVKLPIYIREYKYLDKKLSDVLIISNEQLQRCLRDSKYGEVFRAFIRNYGYQISLFENIQK